MVEDKINVLQKIEDRIKRLAQEPLGFRPGQQDEYSLLCQARDRLRILEQYWRDAQVVLEENVR